MSSTKGTQNFELYPYTKWECDIKSIHPGLIDEFDKIITEFRGSVAKKGEVSRKAGLRIIGKGK